MRSAVILLLSSLLTCIVIGNAYYQKKQFYPSVVYITKSNPSMAVIYIQGLILVFMTNTFLRKIFFGNLRAAELEHLVEKAWYAVTETCLAFTVFRDDFSPKFIALFTLLLFLKSFHWLAEDRVDYMERSPVITWLFHLRVATLLIILSTTNMTMIEYAYESTVAKGASVQLVFGFEYAILLTVVLNISLKYILHTIDLQRETPWENKPVFLLYTELIIGLIKVLLYLAFVSVMVKLYSLPLFALRPMYFTMRNFKKAFQDIVMSRRAIRNMNTFYPDATPAELAAADNVCIICREEMVSASKKLPCNHIFHTACLRSWFQRQQTCPTCRLNILRPTSGTGDNRQQNQAPGGTQTQQSTPAPTPNQEAPRSETLRNPNDLRPSMTQGTGFIPENMPFIPPPFPSIVPLPPVPIPPPNLTTLSEEELKAMEGNLRQAVEARIQTLQRVQLLLDAANAMMCQYQSAATTANIPMPTMSNITSTNSQMKQQETFKIPEPTTESNITQKNVPEVSQSSVSNGNTSNTTNEGNEPIPSTSETQPEPDDEASILRRRRLQKFETLKVKE
ncbi:E3 ubiquitin-protein ligase synoviolin A [Chelonus insularis]|uniref:E3 ubiquitin-protein ligase synoviolin A n=1 Tax=Chelonus insularis TaxID=460826 RepID=UPI00158CACED|nr:E3 ubiquitin-protein ligase synoviolin A [Chelonus insularis]